ncbi:MAG: hypothetical protein ACTSYD_09615 [Candidatus Heimdallarchaeaceae archaeon]
MNRILDGKAFFDNGINKFQEGKYPESIRELIYAEQIFTSQGKEIDTAKVSMILADAYAQLNQIDQARKAAFQAYNIYKSHSVVREHAISAKKLGVFYRMQGNFRMAKQFLAEATELFMKLKDIEELALTWCEIATVYQTNLQANSEHPLHAINAYKRAYELFKKLKDIKKMAEVTLDLAHLLLNLEKQNQSIKCFEESRNLFLKVKNYEYAISICLQLASIYKSLNNTKKVKENLNLALKLMKEGKYPIEKLKALQERIKALF